MKDDERPINITSFNQQGGITAHSVNIGTQPRRMDAASRTTLVGALPSGSKINVTAQMGDAEAFQFAEEIRVFLSSSGYVVDGVDQALFSQPIFGQIIQPVPDGFKIIIGARQ